MTQNGGDEINHDLAFGMAILKGGLVGLPIMIVLITVGVWAITDQGWETSLVIALLPGVLFGGFGGGFAGMIRSMDH